MTSEDRARRAALLCCHFARNFAYYSVLRSSSLLSTEGFWLTVHGNLIEVCVLEWCKLFGNRNGKYHWQNVMPDPILFRSEMISLHGIDDAELDRLWKEMKNYRDDFVAHLEAQETTQIPNLNVPYLLLAFYFRALQASFPVLIADSSLPQHFDRYYDQCLAEAKAVMKQAQGA